MPTSSVALGQLTKGCFYDESTFATPPSAQYRSFNYYKSSLREVAPPVADDIIGGDMQNFRDARPVSFDLSTHDGDLDLPLCLNQIGDWLKLLLGAPSTSNVSANYTHVFTSGAATLPTRTVELKLGASDFRQHIGCTAKSLKFTAKDDKGFQRLQLALIGAGENLLSATASSPAASTARTLDQIKATGATVKLDSVQVGKLVEIDWTYATGAQAERYVDGSARVSEISLPDTATINGNLKIRYTSQTLDAQALAETASTLEVIFSKGANNSLSLLMPQIKLGRAGAQIDGPGGIEQTFPFTASQTGAAAMLTATLKNQITAY